MTGWGAFLPVGAIVARYFRKDRLKWDEWYNLHIVCQTSGYIIGAIGWGVGLWIGTSSKQHNTHRILDACNMVTTQREAEYWEIYHQLLGYALIAMTIANIFQGIHNHNQAHSHKWKWTYVRILGFVASGLEIFRWLKPKSHHQNFS